MLNKLQDHLQKPLGPNSITELLPNVNTLLHKQIKPEKLPQSLQLSIPKKLFISLTNQNAMS